MASNVHSQFKKIVLLEPSTNTPLSFAPYTFVISTAGRTKVQVTTPSV